MGWEGFGRGAALGVAGDEHSEHGCIKDISIQYVSKEDVDALCKSRSSLSIPVNGLPAFSRRLPRLPWFLNGGSPFMCTANMRHPSEYMSDAVVSCSSSAYSGAVESC